MSTDALAVSADSLWGEPRLAYHVQARLSEEARNALSRAQQALIGEVPLPLQLIPAHALHVIHGTLARFAQSGLLSNERIHAVAQLPLTLVCDITRLSIVRERVYPCLQIEEVMSVALN